MIFMSYTAILTYFSQLTGHFLSTVIRVQLVTHTIRASVFAFKGIFYSIHTLTNSTSMRKHRVPTALHRPSFG